MLESMGMVASRRRVGVTVQPRESWHVFDPRLIRWRLDGADRSEQLLSLSELRMGFEPVAAALAAERATPAQCGVLAAAVSDMVVHGRSGDLEAYLTPTRSSTARCSRPRATRCSARSAASSPRCWPAVPTTT